MRRSAGFTLIEVMVSVAILALISIIVWQASGSNIQAKERSERRDELFSSAGLVLDQICDELAASFLYSPRAEQIGKSPNGEVLTKTLFLGKNGGDQDEIQFVSFAHVRYLKDAKESDQAEIGYSLEPSKENEGTFNLIKRVSSPPDDAPGEGGVRYTVLEKIEGFNLRYYDPKKGEWVDEWNTETYDHRDKLPRGVEITLRLAGPEPEKMERSQPITLRTMALVEMAPGPNDF